MAETNLERATRLAKIARSVPETWTDSKNWLEDDLRSAAGLIAARYRVNGAPPLERVYIVQTINAALSFEVLESRGIKDANSFFLIAVRSVWGAHFPDVLDEEQAARIIELAKNPVECGVTTEAVFRHGKNERDDTPFIFSDWAGGNIQAATMEPATAGTGQEQKEQSKIIHPTNSDVAEVANLVTGGMPVDEACRKVAEKTGSKWTSLKTMYNRWKRSNRG